MPEDQTVRDRDQAIQQTVFADDEPFDAESFVAEVCGDA